MAKLTEQKFDIGTDVHGRKVIATCYRENAGPRRWRVESQPTSQLDEGERTDGLTDDNLLELAEAVAQARK
jgi:hypothetical protein